FGFAAAVSGSVIGALIGRGLGDDPVRRARIRPAAAIAAAAVAMTCIGFPLPMTASADQSATVSLDQVRPFPQRTVVPPVTVHPGDAAAGANWFTVTSWQGARTTSGGLVIANLLPVGPGVYRADRPVPVYGQWKTLLRLQRG